LSLSAGAAINAAEEHSTIQLIAAARRHAADIATQLLQAGAAVDAADSEGRTALMWAAQLGAPEVMQVLLQAKATVNYVNVYGATALHQAVTKDQTVEYMPPDVLELVVATLLQAGASTSATHRSGGTALHLAARYSTARTLQQLLAAGADLEAKNYAGETVQPSPCSAVHLQRKFELKLLRLLMKRALTRGCTASFGNWYCCAANTLLSTGSVVNNDGPMQLQ
jgi:ankyrin repeat protein